VWHFIFDTLYTHVLCFKWCFESIVVSHAISAVPCCSLLDSIVMTVWRVQLNIDFLWFQTVLCLVFTIPLLFCHPGPLGVCPHLRFKLVLTLVRYQSFYITLHSSFAVSPFLLAVAIAAAVCVCSSASVIGWPAMERNNRKIELDPISMEEQLRQLIVVNGCNGMEFT